MTRAEEPRELLLAVMFAACKNHLLESACASTRWQHERAKRRYQDDTLPAIFSFFHAQLLSTAIIRFVA
jgi:hypothetical protein